jgi:drug/metabolite transporter (DMT)-like permease
MEAMSRKATILFLGLGIAWGIPYLLIKVSMDELSPAMLVLARTVLASALLLPVACYQGALLPVLRRWRPLLVFALVEIAVPWFFLNHAEQSLPSSTTGLLMAAVPLVGAGLALVTRRSERLGWAGWLGLFIGLAGVVALVGLDVAGSDRLAAASLIVVAVGYAVGPVILSRGLAGLPGIGIMAAALSIVALIYLPITVLGGQLPATMPSAKVLGSVAVLAVVCTAAAFLMLFELTTLIGPVRVTAITYLNPAVAVLAGAVVLDEVITGWTVLGFLLVLAGAFLITRKPGVPDRPAVASPSDPGQVAQDTEPVRMDGVAPSRLTSIGTSATRTYGPIPEVAKLTRMVPGAD